MPDVLQKLKAAEVAVSRLSLPGGLRPLQKVVLEGLAREENIFANLPTGYGKSLCYCLPALAWKWRVWVVSPLLSLIEDQALACAAMGLRVVAWSHLASAAERSALEEKMAAGEWQVVFLSPERLLLWWRSGYFAALEALGQAPDLLALDEFHCLEDWRHFRTGYADLPLVVGRLVERGVPLLALSASLAQNEAQAWMRELCGDFRMVSSALGRENLHCYVLPLEEEKMRWLLLISFLRGLDAGESALVYCASRRETDEVSGWLRSAGFAASAYHAGLPSALRRARSQAFRQGSLRIVCATSAFGMGIDYPKVRRVIHFSMPYDLESYWQEVGRAGRDGRESFAIAFWRKSELDRAWRMDTQARARFFTLWRAWIRGGCRKGAVAEQMGLLQEPCGKCDRCQPVAQLSTPFWLCEWKEWCARERWWLHKAAQPMEWLEKKEKAFGKNLDHA